MGGQFAHNYAHIVWDTLTWRCTQTSAELNRDEVNGVRLDDEDGATVKWVNATIFKGLEIKDADSKPETRVT